MKEENKVYKEFWKPIFGFFGLLNFNQIKRELYDYSFILDEVPKVYMEITDGHISKPNTYAYEVIGEFENNISKWYIHKSELEDLLDYEDNELREKIKELLM